MDTRPVPMHERIRAEIEAGVLSGVWAPGERIPFEHELMARYGCARMTVSKALTALVGAGLIERRRRAGSFVRRPAHASAVLEIPDIAAEVAAVGQIYGFDLLARVRRRASVADQAWLAVPPRETVLVVRGLHKADGRPHAYEDRRIVLGAVPDAAAADFAAEPPGTWLLAHVPWQQAEHHIWAEGADEEVAAVLGLAIGAPCLVVSRRTWNRGAVLTAVRLTTPAGAQRLVARFTPSG